MKKRSWVILTGLVGAVMLTHGEADAERPTYEDDIASLAMSYDQDLRAITGQTRAIPLILSQQHADPITGLSTSTVAAWTSRAASRPSATTRCASSSIPR